MVYIDALFYAVAAGAQAFRVGAKNGHRWCHMWTEPGNEEELHRMAARIGLKREWFQDRKDFPHYDLTPGRRVKAVQAGAVESSLSVYIKNRKAIRERSQHECEAGMG